MRSTAGIAHDAFASIWRVAGRRFRPDPELRQRSAKDFTTEDTVVTGKPWHPKDSVFRSFLTFGLDGFHSPVRPRAPLWLSLFSELELFDVSGDLGCVESPVISPPISILSPTPLVLPPVTRSVPATLISQTPNAGYASGSEESSSERDSRPAGVALNLQE
jgi:hypothetical protein